MVASERWRTLLAQNPGFTGSNEDAVDFDATLDPESPSDNWVYTEKIIYMPVSSASAPALFRVIQDLA
jgi:hypothetical protein